MKRYLLSPFLLFFGLAPALSQQPARSPVPLDDQVVKINTSLIQIDVTVVDKNGKVVSGLKPDDFELYENGQRQKITNFSFVSKISTGVNTSGQSQSQTGQAPSPAVQLKR